MLSLGDSRAKVLYVPWPDVPTQSATARPAASIVSKLMSEAKVVRSRDLTWTL